MEASVLHAPTGLSRISAKGPLLRFRSDDQLVALFRMGYDDAFGVIHDRYRPRLFAYTRQMLSGSRADAEDALQDVFLRAYSALRCDDRPVTLRAWLYRVAHNRCIDQLRRPIPHAADVADASRAPQDDPLSEAERREDLRRLVADVGRLPGPQRSALLMRELEGLSYAELADALAVTIPAIKSLLVRARLGLVEASEARDTACVDIRTDLWSAFDRGVRASGRARRHMRDCPGCRDYKRTLRGAHRELGALSPGGGPFATIAKLLGLGGAGSGAAAGGSAAAGGGGAAVVGGGAAAATATKVVAVVCCAAVVGGGAAEVQQQIHQPRHAKRAHAAPAARPAPAIAAIERQPSAVVVRQAPPAIADHTKPAAGSQTSAATQHTATKPTATGPAAGGTATLTPSGGAGDATAPTAVETQTGGVMAPDETTNPATTTPSTDPGAASSGDSASPATGTQAPDTPSAQSGPGGVTSTTPDGTVLAQGAAAGSPPPVGG